MKKIENGDTVKVNYTGKFEDGSVFDSSMVEGRQPLTVTLGQGQLIPGFEKGLIDMTVGETKTIEIEPSEAYGDVNNEMLQEVEKSVLPEDIFEGMILQATGPQGTFNVLVKEVKETTAIIDGNHPLAGKKLFFDLEVVEVM
jgi:FKBP-type peptidyl-prolyl cis-trans isomerase SlpA